MTGTAFSREARSGSAVPHRFGLLRAVMQHEQPLLAREVEKMEQGLLVVAGPVGVLHDDRRPFGQGVEQGDAEMGRVERLRAGASLPHPHEMGLAARGRARQKLHLVLPFGPSIDQLDGGEVAVADKKIFRAERRAVRQIEGELRESHEALTRVRWAPTPAAFRRCGCTVTACAGS